MGDSTKGISMILIADSSALISLAICNPVAFTFSPSSGAYSNASVDVQT